MKTTAPVFSALLTITLFVHSLALAGGNPNASLALHIAPGPTANPCASAPAFASNCDVNSNTIATAGEQFTVYVLVCNGIATAGVAGMEFGIAYDQTLGSGIDVLGFTSCADAEIFSPTWPDAGSGAILAWDAATNCQTTGIVFNQVFAIGGAFHVTYYDQDLFGIIPFPGTYGSVRVADCSSGSDDLVPLLPNRLGIAGFNLAGINPCFGPDLSRSDIPENLLVSPTGNADYTVDIRDCLNLGIFGATVDIEINPAAPVCLCTGSPRFYSATTVNGIATFNIEAGGCVTVPRLGGWPARITVDNLYMGDLNIISPDAVDRAGRLPTTLGYTMGPPCRANAYDLMWFTPFVMGGIYETCADFDSDGAVGVLDGVIISALLAGRPRCP